MNLRYFEITSPVASLVRFAVRHHVQGYDDMYLGLALRLGARGAAQADRLRRTDLGAGRQRASADPQPARNLPRELGLAYLFITRNIGVVEYIADHVAVMQAGCIVEQGSGEVVLKRPQHEYTRTLLAAVQRLHPHAADGGAAATGTCARLRQCHATGRPADWIH